MVHVAPAEDPHNTVELRGDQTWKKIQQNTFTRWVNQHLKVAETLINDLGTDLCDGIQLIKLGEVLSGKKLPRYNKKPTNRTQMLDNVSQVLTFFQDQEGIKIVNIDSMHIVDQNLKLILGLIYTLIMHYSISKATLIGGRQTDSKETPKQRLLAWIKSRLPSDVPVTNFTSDWNDGVALGALIDACVPGSCSDWRSWKPDEALQNTQKAMKAAEGSLGIAGLITPEELINPNVDEKSVMTYLSQFPPARPQTQGRLTGVEESPMVERPSQFAIDLARPELYPSVEIHNLHGDCLPVKVEQNAAFPTRYDVTYTPEQVGIHKICVTALSFSHATKAGESSIAPTTPATFKIAEATVNAVPTPQLTNLRAKTELGDAEKFRITNVAEGRQLNVVVVSPEGRELEIQPSERVGNASVCRYLPESVGLHSLNVFVDRRHIPGSPFPIRVVNKATDKVVVWGRGVHPNGTSAGDELPIHVDACDRPVTVSVTTKEGLLVPVIQKYSYLNSTPSKAKEGRQKPGHCGKTDERNKRQSFTYVPRSAGPYNVEVKTSDGNHLGKSPYEVKVGQRSTSRVRAVGPGIEGGVKNKKSCFYIDTFGGANSLEFSIEGPNETQISCKDNGDSSAVVDYLPVSSGLYVVNVLNNGDHIKDSPFVLVVDSDDENDSEADNENEKPRNGNNIGKLNGKSSPHSWSSSSSSSSSLNSSGFEVKMAHDKQPKVNVAGLEPSEKGFYVGQFVEFNVEDSPKNKGESHPLDIFIYGPNLSEIELTRRNTTDGKKAAISFLPEKAGKHVISVCRDGIAAQGWPNTITVKEPLDLSHLRVYGPGVGAENILTDQRTNFTVDSRQVGSDRVTVRITDPDGIVLSGDDIDLNSDANPSMHAVSYTPKKEGPHRINVYVEDESTFDIKVDVERKKILEESDIILPAKKTFSTGAGVTTTSSDPTRVRSKTSAQLANGQSLDSASPNILYRERDLNDNHFSGQGKPEDISGELIGTGRREPTDIGSSSICAAAIGNREDDENRHKPGRLYATDDDGTPIQYREQQQYLRDGSEKICLVAIGSVDDTILHTDPKVGQECGLSPTKIHSSTLHSTLSEPKEMKPSNKVPGSWDAAKRQPDNCNSSSPNHVGWKPSILKNSTDRPSLIESDINGDKPPTAIPSTPSQAQMTVAEIPRTVVGHNASLYLKYPAPSASGDSRLLESPPRLTAWIHAPDGATPKRIPIEKSETSSSSGGVMVGVLSDRRNDGLQSEQYRVDFFPEVEGVHSISVYDESRNGREIEGSPFHVSVGLLGTGEAHRVTAKGKGLMTGHVGKLETFRVTLPPPTAPVNGNAGGGEVSVTVDGPSRAEIQLIKEEEENDDERNDDLYSSLKGVNRQSPNGDTEGGNACRVEYRVDEPGLYTFDVRFNDAPIAGSPFRVFIKPKSEDDKILSPLTSACSPLPPSTVSDTTATSRASTISPYSTPAKYVRYEEIANGQEKPQTPLSTTERNIPVRIEPNVSINELNRSKFEIADANLHEFPSPTHVGSENGRQASDFGGKPHRVSARGAGLNEFTVGETGSFFIDTSNAGTDLLFVGVVTSQGPCDEVFVRHVGNGLYEVDYRIRNASSKAVIIIKYGERQIPGSPFTIYPRNA